MNINDIYTNTKDTLASLGTSTRNALAPFAAALALSISPNAQAQDQAGYVCAPGTVPNVSEARTAGAIASLEDTIAQNLPNHLPAIAGKNKLVVNFEGSGPVTADRIGNDVNFARVAVGTNVRQGDGSSTQRFGMNNEGQYVQTFDIEGENDLHGLMNVVERMCIGYEIEIGVRDADGNVIDESRRHNAGSTHDGADYAMHGAISDAGARRITNAKEGMASAVRIDLAELARDVLLGSDSRVEFFPASPDSTAYAIGGDSMFIAAAHDVQGTQNLGTLFITDGERSAEYTLTAQVGSSAPSYSIESHAGSNLTAGQVDQNRAINTFAHTLGSLVDSYGFRLGSEGDDAPLRTYSSAGELEGDLARRGIHRIELDTQTGNVDLFYRLDPNNSIEQERSMTLEYAGETGSFEHQLAIANLYTSMKQSGLDFDYDAIPNHVR